MSHEVGGGTDINTATSGYEFFSYILQFRYLMTRPHSITAGNKVLYGQFDSTPSRVLPVPPGVKSVNRSFTSNFLLHLEERVRPVSEKRQTRYLCHTWSQSRATISDACPVGPWPRTLWTKV